MKYYYGAFKEIPDGVQVDIPDVVACIVDGDTWEDAYANAIDALAGCLSAVEEWPVVSTREEAFKKAESFWPGEAFQIVPVPVDEKILAGYDERIRVNINLPVYVLRKIDEYRAAHRITRSRLLAEAAISYIDGV